MSDQQPQMDQTPGIFCWNEILSSDPAASKAFYSKLFGWKAKEEDMGGGFTYTFFETAAGRPVGGMIPTPPDVKGPPTTWMSYVTVPRLEDAVARAKKLGAKVLKDITPLPMGRFAVVADPQGGAIGLWQFAE